MSLVCVGYHITVTQIVHHFTGKWPEDFEFKSNLVRFIAKPLYTCVLCHASVIGTVVFYLFNQINEDTIKYWVLACMVTVWLNGILYGLFNKLF